MCMAKEYRNFQKFSIFLKCQYRWSIHDKIPHLWQSTVRQKEYFLNKYHIKQCFLRCLHMFLCFLYVQYSINTHVLNWIAKNNDKKREILAISTMHYILYFLKFGFLNIFFQTLIHTPETIHSITLNILQFSLYYNPLLHFLRSIF